MSFPEEGPNPERKRGPPPDRERASFSEGCGEGGLLPANDCLAIVEHPTKRVHGVGDRPAENLAGHGPPVDDGVEVVVPEVSHTDTLTTNQGSVK
jgi:hypothetical protein